ncbi:hypothetical protein FPV67DRAFT_605517 [Lyophyllum atratum]|nr:hypothetical protein FPV67DRAFT_605517 [Lyophyllum atratum]
MDNTATSIDFATVKIVLMDIYYARICQSIASTLTIYDHCITFDQEVNLIWTRKLSLYPALYLLTRYLGDALMILSLVTPLFLTSNISARVSGFLMRSEAWLTMILIVLMQIILSKRVIALYDDSRRVKIGLRCALAIETILLFSVLLAAHIPMKATNQPYPTISFCTPLHTPSWLFVWWLLIVPCDALLFTLAISAAYKHYLAMQGTGRCAGKLSPHWLPHQYRYWHAIHHCQTRSTCRVWFQQVPKRHEGCLQDRDLGYDGNRRDP